MILLEFLGIDKIIPYAKYKRTIHPINMLALVSRGRDLPPALLSLEQLYSLLEKHHLFSLGLWIFPPGLGRWQLCFRHHLLGMGQQESSITRNHLFQKEIILSAQFTDTKWTAQHFLTAALRHSTWGRAAAKQTCRQPGGTSVLTQPLLSQKLEYQDINVESGASSFQRATDAVEVSIFSVAFKPYNFVCVCVCVSKNRKLVLIVTYEVPYGYSIILASHGAACAYGK